MDMLHTTEVMAIFVFFWPILAKIWLPWQRPLDPCNQKSELQGSKNWGLPLTWPVALTTVQHYRADCDVGMNTRFGG